MVANSASAAGSPVRRCTTSSRTCWPPGAYGRRAARARAAGRDAQPKPRRGAGDRHRPGPARGARRRGERGARDRRVGEPVGTPPTCRGKGGSSCRAAGRRADRGVAAAGRAQRDRDPDDGRLDGVPALLRKRFGVPVLLDNNTRLAALGESIWGAAAGEQDVLYLRLSYGVGGGLVVGGALHRGPYGLSAEFGHITVDTGPAAVRRRRALPDRQPGRPGLHESRRCDRPVRLRPALPQLRALDAPISLRPAFLHALRLSLFGQVSQDSRQVTIIT